MLKYSYDVVYNDDNSYAQLGVLKIGNKQLYSPFLWFGISIVESVSFQERVFLENSVEGIMANAFDIKYQDKKDDRKEMIKHLKKHNILIKCDSGGFQNFSRNLKLEPSEVYKIQKSIASDIAIQLDYPLNPSGSEESNKRRIEATAKNYEILYEIAEKDDILIVPVIHGYTEEMLKYSIRLFSDFIGHQPSIVAVGSLVPFLFSTAGSGNLGGKKRAVELLLRLRELLPNSFIHVLGAGGTMSYLMFYVGINSIDNTGWVKKSGYGAIQMPGISDRFIYRTDNGRKSLDDDEYALKSWLECTCPACINNYDRNAFFGRNVNARLLRSIHNVSVYQREIWIARKYIKEGKIEEFVRSRLQNSSYKNLVELINNYYQKLR